MFNFKTRDAFTCSLHYFAFFHNKQRCTLKLDDSVTRKKAGGRRRTEAFTHTHRGFYIEKSLYKGAFYIQKVLHREVFTLRCFCRQTSRSFCPQKFLYEDVFTQWAFYTQTYLHTKIFTQRVFTHGNFYIQKNLYTDVVSHREPFTQRSLYTENLLQTVTFTHQCFYTEKSLHRGALYTK